MTTATDSSYERRRLDGALDARFDAIVVGSGAGGLSTVALLALDGRRGVVAASAVLGRDLFAELRG